MNHNIELANETIQALAPSAFAGQPYEKQSSRYTFIPTVEVINGMRDSGFVPVAAKQSRTRVEGKQYFTKHMIRFRPSSSLEQEAIVGELVPEAVLINSHDGTSAYKLFFGIYRFVCRNGLMVADSMLESISIRHTGNVVREAIEGTRRIFEDSPRVLGSIQQWQNISLQPSEQKVFAESVHSMRFPNGGTDVTPEMLLRPHRYNDEGNSLWLTFNRIQENALKGISANTVRNLTSDVEVSTRQRRVRSSKTVKGIDQDVKLNRAIWSLAEKMAELKTA